jgi:uncharacterized repeat protein (TIGR03803 family)
LSLYGGAGAGVVFKLDPTGRETVLHAFADGADGAFPYAGLIRDAAGNLYGTTLFGGIGGWCSSWTRPAKKTVLYSFP